MSKLIVFEDGRAWLDVTHLSMSLVEDAELYAVHEATETTERVETYVGLHGFAGKNVPICLYAGKISQRPRPDWDSLNKLKVGNDWYIKSTDVL